MPEAQDLQINEFLKRSLSAFASGLDTKNILSELYSADVISDENMDSLRSMRQAGASNRTMTEELWSILRLKSPQQKLDFLKCVQSKQPHLVSGITDLLGAPPSAGRANPGTSDRQKPITRRHVLTLARKAGSKWKKLARELPNIRNPDEGGISDERIKAISKAEDDDEDRFIAMMAEWQALDTQHNWALLYDALEKVGLSALAETTFNTR